MLPASLRPKNGNAASTSVTADITSTSKFRRHPSGVCGIPPSALAFDTTIHLLVHSWPWLAAHTGLILAGTLALVGAYQLSPMKDRCLTACRDPFGFLWQHYRRGVRGALRLGARHALWCTGCCWALMLLMFATGVGSLAWMLGLTGVMVAEKTTRWGARLVVPVGIALLVAGAVMGGLALLGVSVGPSEG